MSQAAACNQSPVLPSIFSTGLATTDNTHDEAENGIEDNQNSQQPNNEAASHPPVFQQIFSSNEAPKALSKNQQKKLLRNQEWESKRGDRKVRRKQKLKERKERQKAALEDIKAKNDPNGNANGARPAKRAKVGQIVPITFIYDCDFEDYMIETEIMSLGQQLTRAYSDNKKALYQAHMVVSSFGGKLKERFEGLLNNHHHNWKNVRFTDESFDKVAKRVSAWMPRDDSFTRAGALVSSEYEKNHNMEPVVSSEDNNIEAIVYSEDDNIGATVYSDDNNAEAEVYADDDAADNEYAGGIETGENYDSETEEEVQDEGFEDEEEELEEEKELEDEAGGAEEGEAEPEADLAPKQGKAREGYAKKKYRSLWGIDGEVVYLTSDSPHTLTHLSPYSTYIIGGLVDKNRHKNICYRKALQARIPTAKLPIGEFMDLKSRTVLATNHVCEIMLKWMEHGDWGKAFDECIPKRKGGVLKEKVLGVDKP